VTGERIYVPVATAYEVGKPRVFQPFEDRGRDTSGLLTFGTVMPRFDGVTVEATATFDSVEQLLAIP
jgi:hypothetical protein